MNCEACVIDSIDVGSVEPRVRQDDSSLWIKNVEDALYLHPAVRECVVMDMFDQTRDDNTVVFVTLQAELNGWEQELRDWVRYTVDDCRIPERIVVLPDLPKLPSGKVDRSALQELISSFETGIQLYGFPY